MVLLVMVALAMLSLSSVELRAARSGDAQGVARANARMALMVALGELQKEMGPDQRISVNANVMAADSSGTKPTSASFDARTNDSEFSAPYTMAVYDAWDTWLSENEIKQTYSNNRQTRFRKLLVSHPSPDELEGHKGVEIARNGFGSQATVVLLGDGGVGAGRGDLHGVEAPLVSMQRGRYAWSISGNNMKFMMPVTKEKSVESLATSATSLSSLGYNRLKDMHADLQDFPNEKGDLEKVISLGSAGLSMGGGNDNDEVIRKYYHALTPFAQSLPVDVRNGGLKKDPNTLLELDVLPKEYGSLSSNPDADTVVSIRANSGAEAGDLRSPVYSRSGKNFTSWYKLHQYYQQYRGSQSALNESPADQIGIAWRKGLQMDESSPITSFQWHRGNMMQRSYCRTPVVARLLMELGIQQKVVNGQKKYYLALNPVMTLWNPYNVTMEVPKTHTVMNLGSLEIKIYRNGTLYRNWGELGNDINFNIYTLPKKGQRFASVTLLPGEAKMFSAVPGRVSVEDGKYTEIYLGYEKFADGAGLLRPLPFDLPQDGSIEMAVRIGHNKTPASGFGHINAFQFYWTTQIEQTGYGQRFNEMAAVPIEVNKPIVLVPDKGGERLRFGTAINKTTYFGNLGYALKSGDLNENINTEDPYAGRDYRCKNLIFAKPWNNRNLFGQATDRMKGMAQQAYFFEAGNGNSANPDIELATNRGFVISSFKKNGEFQGQTFAPLAEIPVAPVTSLAAFQMFRLNPGFGINGGPKYHHWDVSTNHGLGIGSSYASPLIPGNEIYHDVEDAEAVVPGHPQMGHVRDFYDHSFINNDALFDQWFCSGLTPQDSQTFNQKKGTGKVLDDFLSGTTPLLNESLIASLGHKAEADVKSKILNGGSPSDETHKQLAKYVRIRGGFNVNSTEVDAWKALFMSMAQDEFHYVNVETGDVETKSFSEPTVLISRLGMPCSPDEASVSEGANDPNTWRGVRYLTEAQIEKLAQECVRQVKLRGPFLNLSDFVNRRLSADELGVCGALQAAIDWDEYNGNNPKPSSQESINGRFKQAEDMISAGHVGAWKKGPSLEFQQAYYGSRWTAAPGYVTQGDILKRIGNRLTVRDDTFTIRAYGEARSRDGSKILARAYCEAVVVREIDFVDASQAPETLTVNLNPVNSQFGRRIRIQSFRWLSKDEI